MSCRRVILVLAVLIACLVPRAARARGFSVYAQAYLDTTRAPSARVTAEVPYKSLVFFKRQGWYDARYEVYVSIEDLDRDERPRTAVMSGQVVARSYDETTRIDMRAKSTRTFTLAPGHYRVTASLRENRTDVVVTRTLDLEIPDFLARGIGFGSTMVMMLPPGRDATFARWDDFKDRGAPELAAPPDASLELFDRRPAVRFQLFLDGAAASSSLPCMVYYEAVAPDDEQVLYGRHRVELTGHDDTFILSFNVDDWEPGAYTINLRATTENPARDASTSIKLNVDVTRAMLGRNFDETLETLSLIASSEALEGLKNAPPGRRAEEWSKFWAARDPDPSSLENEALEEYLRRVRYVAKAFSNVEPGWRTDRGRVYIRNGPPDRIERATDSRYQGEYEIWRYFSTGRVYVFYDMFGLGDYRLVQGDIF